MATLSVSQQFEFVDAQFVIKLLAQGRTKYDRNSSHQYYIVISSACTVVLRTTSALLVTKDPHLAPQAARTEREREREGEDSKRET